MVHKYVFDTKHRNIFNLKGKNKIMSLKANVQLAKMSPDPFVTTGAYRNKLIIHINIFKQNKMYNFLYIQILLRTKYEIKYKFRTYK